MTCKGVIIIAEILEVIGREVLEKCNLLRNAVFSLPILFRFKERGFCNDSWDELVLTSQSMQILMKVLSET